MSLIIVDVESDGPIPAEFSMVCFGAVLFDELVAGTPRRRGACPRT
jgi:hypothetical protein